jgi:hypothetical protein
MLSMPSRFKGRKLKPDERNVIEKVEKYGWMVMSIKDEPGKPGWSYTVGLLESFRHPEVIIFGLEVDNRHRILNWIGENVKKKNPFVSKKKHDWVLDGYKCWSKPVDPKWHPDLLGYAIWFYGEKEFSCLQAIWPDKGGHYPWEPKYSSSDQPLLYEQELLAARMMHWASDAELTKAEWPFTDEPHTRTFVSRCVVEDGAAIVRVARDWDGDWQFIGPVEDPNLDGGEVSCFHCIVERDPSIKLLAGLPPGHRALRDSVSTKWRIEKIASED